MKKLKKFSDFKLDESFDDYWLKNNLEIPYLQGILFDDFTEILNLSKESDPLVRSIVGRCPFIIGMGYRRFGNFLNIGFKKEFIYGKSDKAFAYYEIEISESKMTNRYVCNIYAKCVGNDQLLYNESSNNPLSDFESMIRKLNSTGYKMLVEFNSYTKKIFDYSGTNHFTIRDKPINPQSN